MSLNWMAWTPPTATFFIVIFCMLVGMVIWEIKCPGGAPRVGILRFETTRGDRLFVTLLGSAFIHLAWLGLTMLSLWWAFAIACIYALCVFRWV